MQLKQRYSSQMQNFGEQHPGFRYWHDLMHRRVRVYDNGGATLDRYTVHIRRTEKFVSMVDVFTMNDQPNHPTYGINMYSHTVYKGGEMPLDDGKRVQVVDLPEAVIAAIEDRLEY